MKSKQNIKMVTKKSISLTKGRQEFVHGTYDGDLRNGKKHGVVRGVLSGARVSLVLMWGSGLMGGCMV